MEINYLLCTGCGACENICPVDAITMQEHDDGFLYPNIEKDKCIKCKRCMSVCHNIVPKPKQNSIRECYAAWAPDHIREKSSSGGVFSVIVNYVLERDGYVCGASFIENTSVKHIIINKGKDLFKLRTSKYIQSEIGVCYRKVREILNAGKIVLFSGTPCQVAGLYLYLGFEPEHLYTIDILCHGVPSQNLFNRYLLEKYHDEKIKKINFRDKKDGWTYNLKLKVETESKIYISNINDDEYYKAFDARLSLRKSCGFCDFSSPNRMGDITLGDFWEIWKYDKTWDDKKGTSLVLLNSVKGEYLFQKIIEKLQKTEKMPLKNAMQGNCSLYQSTPLHTNRENFFSDLKVYSLCEALEKNV